jgi:CRISPR-associated endonuclease/helicase Cas3
MLDAAACTEAVMLREPATTRQRMAEALDLEWPDALSWLLLLAAGHDLGKACPGFQCKWPELLPRTGLRMPPYPKSDINHAFVSQIAMSERLAEAGWPAELAELASDAAGSHHGERASPTKLERLRADRRALGDAGWEKARRVLFETLRGVFRPGPAPEKLSLTGPEFMLIAGLISFADWISSNEDLFQFGTVEECRDPEGYFQRKRGVAAKALGAIGWSLHTVLSAEKKPFDSIFGFRPRPLQQTVADALPCVKGPSVLLVEAPMGEGKTEAAYYAYLEMQRRFGHRGLYIALPTQATGNAMFNRTLDFLKKLRVDRGLDLQLVHGAALMNEAFQKLRVREIHDPEKDGAVRAGEWFTHKKRALLSEHGVGTVDQALMPILPVRHHFVRLWGLANRVVIFDEIHAYDAYTGTLLIHLLRWLLALGSSVVLLTATLPPSIRRKTAMAVGAVLTEEEAAYPRLSVFHSGEVQQRHFEPDPDRRLSLKLAGIASDLPTMRAALIENLAAGGMGLALVNTVQRAQDLYANFPYGEAINKGGCLVGKRLADGTEVYLFHARYPAEARKLREDHALECFGLKGSREGRKILVATQVVEQSLDLDFDLIATDLAPIDLLLQRAGRLWRHARSTRPPAGPLLLAAGLTGEEPPSFGRPLWWDAVYSEYRLLLTWVLLRRRSELRLPEEIDSLVRAVYEESVDVPPALSERRDKSLAAEGEDLARIQQAHQAIIGLPDDGSWNDPSRLTLFDEDGPGVHRALLALTRLGEESLLAVPLDDESGFSWDALPDFRQAAKWFGNSVRLSRRAVVHKLKRVGVPDGWSKSPLLRNCYPMLLDGSRRWKEDATVRLDEELGVVYETREDG